MKVTEAIPLAWQALDHPSPSIRAAAAQALGYLLGVGRSQQAVKELAERMRKEPNPIVRKAIVSALSLMDYLKPRSVWEKLFGRRRWMKKWEELEKWEKKRYG